MLRSTFLAVIEDNFDKALTRCATAVTVQIIMGHVTPVAMSMVTISVYPADPLKRCPSPVDGNTLTVKFTGLLTLDQ